MLSSDKNIEYITHLLLEIKRYVELRGRYIQLDFAAKMIRLLSSMVICVVIFSLLSVVVFFASLTLATFISNRLDSEPAGYGVVALLYCVMIGLIYAKRRVWIERPLANFLGRLFLERKVNGQADGNTQRQSGQK